MLFLTESLALHWSSHDSDLAMTFTLSNFCCTLQRGAGHSARKDCQAGWVEQEGT